MGRLAGKRAIVTGAGSGIGRAAALLFASEGARVLCVDRTEAVQDTVKSIVSAGGTGEAMVADAGLEADVQRYVGRAVSAFGGVDVLYANAGISGGYLPVTEQTVEQWQEVLRVNLLGPFLAIKHVTPLMIAQKKGSIICTASVAGIRANAGPTAYSASKAGVISLVQTTANELYGTGVRVNAICPGLIETGMTKPIFDGARARGSEAKIGRRAMAIRWRSPTWRCSWPRMRRPMSMGRPFLSMVALPRPCRLFPGGPETDVRYQAPARPRAAELE
jgi:NAD(P)-dependent dehydrogenase (short-subunit alcohol dehydrogenase family)